MYIKSHMSRNQLNDWDLANSRGESYNNKRNYTYTERWKVNHSQFHNSSHDTRWNSKNSLTLFVSTCQLQITCFSTVQHFPSHFPQYPKYSSLLYSLPITSSVIMGFIISCIADAVLCLERSSAKWCSLYKRKIIIGESRNLGNMMSSLHEPH